MYINKKGISLVVLVVTVIVMAILLGAIFLDMSDNNVEVMAEEAKIKQTVSTFLDELDLAFSQYKLDEAAKGNPVDRKNYSKSIDDTKKIITTSKGTIFEGKIKIEKGQLILQNKSGLTQDEINWFESVPQ